MENRNQMVNDDLKIHEFRNILKSIKQKVLDKFTYNSQNTAVLEKVTKRLIQFYLLLKPVVYDNKPVDTIPIKELHELFYETLENYVRSSYYQNCLEYYLKRDFIDFPFSIDEDKIDTFKSYEHYEQPHIVENNTLE